uniref:CDP-alcohol phosphatidyltransferase family protein n=1 Tax=Endozoicomonas sp. ONNA2 TaxID=2828741 RepID=UPI002148A5FA
MVEQLQKQFGTGKCQRYDAVIPFINPAICSHMIDKWTTSLIQPPLRLAALQLQHYGITPNQVTITGFLVGMLAVPLLAFEFYSLAMVLILGNRILDGLDGALARLGHPSDAGGFLDITLDFIFYAAIVMG